MDPISNVDQLVLLLRQRLAERARTGGRAGASATKAPQARPAEGLKALAALDGLNDRQLGRALIQNLLVSQLGRTLLNEAKFQQMVDQVTDTVYAEPQGARLIERVVKDLRASAR